MPLVVYSLLTTRPWGLFCWCWCSPRALGRVWRWSSCKGCGLGWAARELEARRRKKTCVVFSCGACPPMGGTAHQLTAAYGGSMRGPAQHPSLRHPMTFRYVQPRPPSAR
eukprot:scaffold7544_cov107-Isochrysis_galbana.AAC.19